MNDNDMIDPICTCGHPLSEHRQEEGPCYDADCRCEEYVEA